MQLNALLLHPRQFDKPIFHHSGRIDDENVVPHNIIYPLDILENKLFYKTYDLEDLFSRYHTDVISVTVTSDGMASFENRENKSLINEYEALDKFVSYKNYFCGFLERRFETQVHNYNKLGYVNCDDFSMAGIVIKRD